MTCGLLDIADLQVPPLFAIVLLTVAPVSCNLDRSGELWIHYPIMHQKYILFLVFAFVQVGCTI